MLALNESRDLRGILRFSHSAMATLFEIYCSDAREDYARQAADPRTMSPVRLRQAAWVAGLRATLGEMQSRAALLPDTTLATSPAAIADALSTAFMILSREVIGEFSRKWPGLEIWVLEGADSGEQPIALHRFPPQGL